MKFREFTLDFEQQACQRIGIAYHIFEGFRVYLHNLVEIRKQCLGFEYVSMVVYFYIRAFFLVVFVIDFSHNLLDDVFHRDDTRGSAEFIHHDSDVNLVGLEVAQEVVNHLRFGHEVGGADKALPLEIFTFLEMRKQVLDIQNTLDVVSRIFINGHTRITVFYHAIQHLLESGSDVQIHHIKA